MRATPQLQKGRRAVAQRAWGEAHSALAAARRAGPLEPQDLWWLALASYLVGQEPDFLGALREAHQGFLDAGEVLESTRAAFWVGQHLASRGETAAASGWFARSARLVEERQSEGAARGYALFPAAHHQLVTGDYQACARTSDQVAEIGRRCGDADLAALAIHLRGRALLRLGGLEEGLALLDEAMIAVSGDELSPVAAGLIYCSVLSACREVYELRRAKEWTAALTEWCERQPDMVAYTGPCRVSRAEILQRRGDWAKAADEARRAVDLFDQGPESGAAGPALYQQGEVYRLRGEYAAAEEAFRAAGGSGGQPQPGLALLRLAQGDTDGAAASLRRALAETQQPLQRARLLPAQVEVLLELGDTSGAAAACSELEGIAAKWPGRVLQTLAAHARGATLLATGDPEGALVRLREACLSWDALDAPYDGARVRVLLGRACDALGDREGAHMELGAARATFERLGAAPDIGRLAPAGGRAKESDHGLTPRELEVLEWLATGQTNRAVADALFISEKTVARHVANIFTKLGLSSRAAATAYAYEHDLVRRPT